MTFDSNLLDLHEVRADVVGFFEMGNKLGVGGCFHEELIGVFEDLGAFMPPLEYFDVSKVVEVSFANDDIVVT